MIILIDSMLLSITTQFIIYKDGDSLLLLLLFEQVDEPRRDF